MPFVAQPNNRMGVTLSAADGTTVLVYQQGAHVASWKPMGGKEALYLSPTALFKDGAALRGGVPIIWPQFSDMGPGPVHGVARNRNWELIEESLGGALFALRIRSGDTVLGETANVDLYFKLQFTATDLKMTLRALNVGDKDFAFTTAFHTYFAVSSIHATKIHGLDKTSYADNLQKRKVCDPAEIRTIDQEVDRIYFNVTNPVVVADAGLGRNLVIASNGLPDVVLWNPWVEKAKKFADMPDDGFKSFVCVEHGAIQHPVVIAAQKEWEGSQTVTIQPQSKI